MYLDKVKDYKARQTQIIEQMARHEKADHNFYVTANIVMNLAARAKEIFESSEVDEKRQLLNLVFQDLNLDGKNLLMHTCEPFLPCWTTRSVQRNGRGWTRTNVVVRRGIYRRMEFFNQIKPVHSASIEQARKYY